MHALLLALLIPGLMFFLPILGVFFGAVTGWIVGLFFGGTILGILSQMGIDCTMWQFGAFLGFAGAFFRPSFTKGTN